jgi:putative SOS response-associated peptidase YedK
MLRAKLDAGVDLRDQPHWNVAPTNTVLGLSQASPRSGEQGLVLRSYRWGLVPPWSKSLAQGSRMFNARAESVASAPSFRSAFRSHRVAVIADGYFEWRKAAPASRRHGALSSGARRAGPGQPYYFTRRDGQPLAFAGLYAYWRDPARDADEEAWLRSCTIVTTVAGPDLDGIHDRMPVVLDADRRGIWLDRDGADEAELQALLVPAPHGTLVRHPVDRRVGNVANDDPGLLEPVEEGDAGGDTAQLALDLE